MISFEVFSGPTRMNVRSMDVFVRMIWGGNGWISPTGGETQLCLSWDHSASPNTYTAPEGAAP